MTSAQPADFEAALRPWWDRGQSGDEAAYRHALSLIARRLRAYIRRRMPDQPDEVEDMVQEVLLSLHLHRGSYDGSVPVSAWILAVARHRLIDDWRRRGRQPRMLGIDDAADEGDALTDDGGQASQEARRDLHQLLETLPEAQRRAIELTHLAGLSGAEAAAATGASESAIKVQVHRGLKRLAAQVRGKP
ncbi:MAG: sigma-70 family RNA polymerase sigma factor [Inhella sp.]|jgi:RNA polymerase sigma-70 factor (ECF subfamily)|nr:sigma-70 family RNA polymerase sigma factor [Inhella sp.]MCZ8233972.1 sigma-70 family RNA polymerase sigma factor [Inhella sp.]